MVDVTPFLPDLSPLQGKAIVARLDGGRLSSEGGLLALREIERRLGIAHRLAACLKDPRMPEKVVHLLAEIIRFRMLMIVAGYEDGNDADTLRRDPMFKVALDRLPSGDDLCSQSTISLLENLPGRGRCCASAGLPTAPPAMRPRPINFACFLHAGAYWLLWSKPRVLPKRSTWRVMQFDTLRLRLVKIAARVVELKTQLKIHLPSSAPDQGDLCHAPRPAAASGHLRNGADAPRTNLFLVNLQHPPARHQESPLRRVWIGTPRSFAYNQSECSFIHI
jgi:hypothetical protein